jgi:hypothetical protein
MSTATFQDGQLFRGSICDQLLTKNMNHDVQVIITVQIDARVLDEQDLRALVEIPRFEREVYLTILPGTEQGRIAERNLDRLGVDEADIKRLHPDHADGISLIDKQVFVRCRVKGESTYWNLAWPRLKPTAITLEEAQTLLGRRQASGLPSSSNPVGGGAIDSTGGDTSAVSQ